MQKPAFVPPWGQPSPPPPAPPATTPAAAAPAPMDPAELARIIAVLDTTYQDLGAQIGIGPVTMSRWANSHRRISPQMAMLLRLQVLLARRPDVLALAREPLP